jgi:arylsulfatase A-like enzyme
MLSMTSRRRFLESAAFGAGSMALPQGLRARSRRSPNIVFIYTDDLGCADLSCCGGKLVKTTNLDRLAGEGVRFTQFYVASPICSPSRVGVTTGMFPARWRINDYLHQRAANRDHEMADWLDLKAPVLARTLKQAGYATGHFGKWHMGGGRDVKDAPEPSAYGFDESFTQFEGMGPRIDPKTLRYRRTAAYVDKAMDFIRRRKDRPFYVNLWPDDVHTPHVPDPEVAKKYTGMPKEKQNFCAVLEEYDRQVGRFLDQISALGLDEDTIILFTGDNGPEPSFDYERTGGLRGMKWSLYEGGIREPLIVRWKSKLPAGRVDESTVIGGVDFFPSLSKLAGVPLPKGIGFDGEDLSAAMLGKPQRRKKRLYWEYGRKPDYLYPRSDYDKSPNVAVRDGKWKLLVNADGSRTELYDLAADPKETTNLAERQPDTAKRLRDSALAWRKALP